jgi:hypothetical protein
MPGKLRPPHISGIPPEIGDYEWNQLSMWDQSPNKCIEKFVQIGDRPEYAHYILSRIIEVHADNSWRVEYVENADGVPGEVLNWRNNDWRIKCPR